MTTPQMDWLDDQRRKRAVSSDDIVTRLRTVVAVPHGVDIWTTTALEAADEIERLRAERDASRLIISDLTAEVERLRDEMSTMHRTVVHDCCVQVQSERALADQLAEVLRLVAVDSYMLPLGTDEAVDSALDTWQEACRER